MIRMGTAITQCRGLAHTSAIIQVDGDVNPLSFARGLKSGCSCIQNA
jgi:hypothetical protein